MIRLKAASGNIPIAKLKDAIISNSVWNMQPEN
jgi:hypothetical protein